MDRSEQLELRDLVEQALAVRHLSEHLSEGRNSNDIPPYPSRRWENVPTGDYL